MRAIPALRPIKQRVLIEPTWDNRRVQIYAHWLKDNFDNLVRYYTRLVGLPGDSHDLGSLKSWLCGKWCDQKMRSRS